MIQRHTQYRVPTANRRTVAAMLVFWLNLALLPCAMAFEAVTAEHDCCPPSIELQQADCCEPDAVTRDHRDSEDFGVAIVGPTKIRSLLPSVRATVRQVSRPPDPGGTSPRIHVLNCVYLK
jgi:hypothetical protein